MRALLIVLDSVGVGEAPDAALYGDEGANTLGHILEQCPDLRLPALRSLGLTNIVKSPLADSARQIGQSRVAQASFGRMQERSAGKDTTTGHWELAGVILDQPFQVFERFPAELVSEIEGEAEVKFIGNYASSGTVILEKLGPEHMQTGNPILYTSADSVLQIAAHEQIVPVERLYQICEIARGCANSYRIGRVIARPFEGAPCTFRRTSRRHDYSMRPPPTILNALTAAGMPVIGVGKIGDIFAGEGLTESHPTASNQDGMAKIDQLWGEARDGLVFVNLVDFDMLHGHRRDVTGYARALRQFDDWLEQFRTNIFDDDLVIITADHGNDPTFRGTDHTREQVPLFIIHKDDRRDVGTRQTFADVAASLAQFFQLSKPWATGKSFLN